MRSLVDSENLPYAYRWEVVRCHYHRQFGRFGLAEECRAAANNYGQRLFDVTGVSVERIE